MDTILRNHGSTLSHTFFAADSETATDSTTAVTVTITRDNGSALVTAAATSSAGNGTYSYVLAPQSQLDVLKVSWSATISGVSRTEVDYLEVVGNAYATVDDVRALRTLDNAQKFSLAKVKTAMTQAEQLFENYCNVSFVPRYGKDTLSGDGTTKLFLSRNEIRELIDVTQDGTTLDDSAFAVFPTGKIVSDSDSFSTTAERNIVVRYEHGYTLPPADIKRAFLTYVRYLLLDEYNRIDDRTLTINEDGMYYNLARASTNQPTGYPTIDSVLNNYKRSHVLVG